MEKTFGVRLREERNRLKLSQAEVAIKGGVSRATQISYEADTQSPNTRYLENLQSFGFDPGYLVSGRRIVLTPSHRDLLVQVLSVISEAEEKRGTPIPLKKQATFIAEVLEEADVGGADRIGTTARGVLRLLR